jgi:endogenous inhibitor of DNA gyrase (YacG/DUF329 family)
MSLVRCPTCRKQFDTAAASKFVPFCSERCQQIDLGRWLGEKFSVPVQRVDEDDDDDFGEPGSNGHDEE